MHGLNYHVSVILVLHAANSTSNRHVLEMTSYAEQQLLPTIILYVDAVNTVAYALHMGYGFHIVHTRHSLMGWVLIRQSHLLSLLCPVVPVAVKHVSIRL